jgi:hypothetical protein
MVVIIDNGNRCQYGCLNEFKRFTTIHSIEKWLLPYHIRCACHTLNLVSMPDVKKITDKKFQSMRKSVEKKLRKLCKKQNHSTKNSDMIQENLGTLFIKENDTRWNSLYNALFRLQHFMSIKGSELGELMEIFKVDHLRPIEVEYVSEYTKVFSMRTALTSKHLIIILNLDHG